MNARSAFMRATARLVAVALLASGCSKSLPTLEDLPPSSPNGADANAGEWRYLVVSGPGQFSVAPPTSTASDAYQTELAAIRTAQANITEKQQQAIEYWSGGAVLRWNQIMRELVARYNLPPAPRPDGTYPPPDANNPFADPVFPVANPPYAARAYSYASMAIYEALKVAWAYKFQYNRPAPHQVDSGVRALLPATNVPAYPSEDAVVSGAATELLRLMFPAAVEEITLRAGEQREAALVGGRATASDIAAGLALGRAVAAVFMARAGTDGMGAAAGNAAQWQALAAAATARGEIAWRSLELPPRPPMLSNFGNVRAWMLTPTDIVAERPGPPPSTS